MSEDKTQDHDFQAHGDQPPAAVDSSSLNPPTPATSAPAAGWGPYRKPVREDPAPQTGALLSRDSRGIKTPPAASDAPVPYVATPLTPEQVAQNAAAKAAHDALPTQDEAKAELEAHPGRHSVLSKDGWVTA